MEKTVTQELWEDTSSKSSSRLLFPSFLGPREGRCYASPSEEVAALSLHTLPSQIRFEQKLGQPTGTLAPPYTPWWTRENLQTGSGPDLSLISLLLWRGCLPGRPSTWPRPMPRHSLMPFSWWRVMIRATTVEFATL